MLRLSDLRATDGAISDPSLETEGFMQCAPDETAMLHTANTCYRDESEPMAALLLDPAKISAPVRFESASSAAPGAENTLIPRVFGPIERSAIAEIRYARRDVTGTFISLDHRSPLAESLDLLPHPEGGWFRETWRSAHTFTPAGYSGTRAAGTAIYFMLGPGERSVWHRVRSDELWLWHAGRPLGLTLGGDGPQPDAAERHVLGGDVLAGERPQVLVPAGSWQSAEPLAGEADDVLVSCVVSPGFDFADFDPDGAW
ncbi:cupin domain-containing protein [Nocardia sp. NPDC051750]|uniref:cupin domain-containing protein n=1 Tax=Nocardia sp. NPDC051750 TaxID=3364325 RepID=UPI0037A22233